MFINAGQQNLGIGDTMREYIGIGDTMREYKSKQELVQDPMN